MGDINSFFLGAGQSLGLTSKEQNTEKQRVTSKAWLQKADSFLARTSVCICGLTLELLLPHIHAGETAIVVHTISQPSGEVHLGRLS